jgi:hypothetical protein
MIILLFRTVPASLRRVAVMTDNAHHPQRTLT